MSKRGHEVLKEVEKREQGLALHEVGRILLFVGLPVVLFSFMIPWFSTPVSVVFIFGTYDDVTNTFHVNELTAFFCVLLILLGISFFERKLFPGITGVMLLFVALGFGEDVVGKKFRAGGTSYASIGGFLLVLSSLFFFIGKEPEKEIAYMTCPFCGWINSIYVERCEECGRYIPEEYLPIQQESNTDKIE